MKGIVLAGGLGTRLYPLTKVTNKHLLPIGGEPMIYYPIRKLVEAGIKDIMIVIGIEHGYGTTSLLGSGNDMNCSITYRVQDKSDGIGGALRLCKDFVGEDDCLVLLGDNIFKEDLIPHIKDFQLEQVDCKLFFKQVTNPQRYGVGVFDNGKLVEIEEKPEKPKTNLACVGIYMYSSIVFKVIDTTEPSARGEYEISSVNNMFIEAESCSYASLKERWVDAGTMESYHTTNWAIYNDKM